jgi:hypothetical protein
LKLETILGEIFARFIGLKTLLMELNNVA